MTWQIINLAIDLLLILEVVYLFTSGQSYMKEAIKRNDRNFFIERTYYALIGVSAACDAIFSQSVEAWTCLKGVPFALILINKCVTAYKHKHSKDERHAIV